MIDLENLNLGAETISDLLTIRDAVAAELERRAAAIAEQSAQLRAALGKHPRKPRADKGTSRSKRGSKNASGDASA